MAARLGGAGRSGCRNGTLPGSSLGVAVFRNRGDGTWRRQDPGPDRDQSFGDRLELGDFDGDGRLDFATSTSTFGNRNLLGLRSQAGWAMTELPGLRPRAYVRSLAAADFDRDGRDDLAVSSVSNQAGRWWSAVDVFFARGDGRWQRRTLDGRQGRDARARSLAAGDLDGDGCGDLVALTDGGETWIFPGDGKGGFSREASPEIAVVEGGCGGYHAALADLDGDGRDELVAGFAGEPSAYFAPGRCPSLGALYAWDAVPAKPAARAAAGAR